MHASLLLYIPSNNAGKNIITKTFSTSDSDPVRFRVEGSPASSKLENSSNCFNVKHSKFVFESFQADLFDPWGRGGCVRTHRTPPAYAPVLCNRTLRTSRLSQSPSPIHYIRLVLPVLRSHFKARSRALRARFLCFPEFFCSRELLSSTCGKFTYAPVNCPD